MDKGKNITFKPYKAVLIAVAAVVLCIALIFSYLHYKSSLLAEDREAKVEFTGNIEAEDIILSFKIPGKIASLLVNEGDMVKKGQVVAKLDTEELALKVEEAGAGVEACRAQIVKANNAVELQRTVYESQVNAAKAALEQAQAGYNLAAATWERISGLYEKGAVSGQQKDEALAQYNAALGKLNEAQAALDKAISSEKQIALNENDVASAKAQLALAQSKYDQAVSYLNNASLLAPADGIVTLKVMKAGEMVAAGTPVLKITDLHKIWVKVYVPETKIGKVSLGQKAKVFVQGFPGQAFEGTVTWINPAGEFATKKAVNDQYDQDIRSFEVKVSIANPKLLLKSGMTATVKFWEGD
jgi:HlyD family secretion protein